MESKPLVTCHGDQALFSSLHPAVLHGLPKEPAEWKRSYGRPSKMVSLEASFVPYDVDILPDENDKTLISRPYFHIYWTDCDLESYRQSVREDITEWQNGLKCHNIPHWLIVVVITDESKVKSKLLPRASVIDKVRNDFCNKNQDRCVVLTEPMKSEQRSTESWCNFYQKLRLLLLQAFNQHLSRYEENMRALRERRIEPGWSFNDYFLVQEELAFMFEMLGLFDDALIQYDELDILFTQSVQSHVTGEALEWMVPYAKLCQNWAGLQLKKQIDWEKRDILKIGQPTLLELRNYLFSRQCAVLFLLHRPWEVAIRASEFLSTTVQEVKSLNIPVLEGAVDCWGFLSCLELLQVCEQYTDMSHMESFARYTAILWDYSREKLKDLGIICGLMPGFSAHPSSEQLCHVIDLTSGMGIADDDEVSQRNKPHPRDRLREALSSEESFRRIYLELAELTMGTFKHVGRYRSARMLGKNLAQFYMQINQPEKAENFFLEALKGFLQEKWKYLADSTQLELAQCYRMMASGFKYLKTACCIVSSPLLKLSDRKFYLNEIKKLSLTEKDNIGPVQAVPFFTASCVNVVSTKVCLADKIKVTLTLHNHAPEEITCDDISLVLRDCSQDLRMDPGCSSRNVARQLSDDGKAYPVLTYLNEPEVSPATNMIELQAHVEGKASRPISSSLVCVNTHEVLRRIDSSGSNTVLDTEIPESKNSPYVISLSKICLQPGHNPLSFEMDAEKQGSFKVYQLSVKMNNLEFVGSFWSEEYIEVILENPSVNVHCEEGCELLSGIQQEVDIELLAGCLKFDEEDTVIIRSITPGLNIVYPDSDTALKIPPVVDGKARITLKVFQDTVFDGSIKTLSEFSIFNDKFNSPIIVPLTFFYPFTVCQKLHTANKNKYIQVVLTGNSDKRVTLKSGVLDVLNSKDVEVIPMSNYLQENHDLQKGQQFSILWLMKSNIPNITSVNMSFNLKFNCSADIENTDRELPFSFIVENYQTLFTVSVQITPPDVDTILRTGKSCTIVLKVKRSGEKHQIREQPLMYEFQTDLQAWKFLGETNGDMSCDDVFETQLDIIPLSAGFLPLPTVKLLRKAGHSPRETVSDIDIRGHSRNDTTEFCRGQVYYSSIGQQVKVLPESVSSDVEIIVV